MERSRILYVFSIAALLLIVTIAAMYEIGLRVLDDQEAMSHELQVANDIADLASTLKDTETGQRGFLLTGEEAYLEPYQQGLKEVNLRLNAVANDAAAGNVPPEQFAHVKTLVAQKLQELDRTIRLRREKGLDATLVVVRSDRGRKLMDQIRSCVAQMESANAVQFDTSAKRASRMTQIRTVTFVIGGLLNLLCLAWSYKVIHAEMNRRNLAMTETTRQRELLSTTLASIGDAVILTDEQGFITFLNREAERLTAWTNSSAAKKLLPEVFHIVNEQSREPVENPVEKVLRLGKVVGLANHTILIAKNGAEIPIDDSAAPIRHIDGTIFGTVLVFRDVTEQKKTQAALAQRREELERLVEERTAKLSEMVAELQHVSYALGHDMRAPLRAMSGFARILLEETAGMNTPEISEYSQRIIAASDRLDRLIQDSLNYTRAVLQETPMAVVDLDTLVRGLVQSYPNLQPDQADIIIDGKLPRVTGNEALLTQCFSNLLGNAVKFVAPNVRPRVRVSAEAVNKTVLIRVEDNGIGIPPQSRERIFNMFERLSNDYEGTGIGLAIVRKVVERMDGKVGVNSKDSTGSQFWLELPLADS